VLGVYFLCHCWCLSSLSFLGLSPCFELLDIDSRFVCGFWLHTDLRFSVFVRSSLSVTWRRLLVSPLNIVIPSVTLLQGVFGGVLCPYSLSSVELSGGGQYAHDSGRCSLLRCIRYCLVPMLVFLNCDSVVSSLCIAFSGSPRLSVGVTGSLICRVDPYSWLQWMTSPICPLSILS